ncbi:serine protease 27-like [Acipenser oxyrinchus oxyrinchus]|uniref:Serine protease 27-like n=1 Tax=Acipenser oxyrinchus oxyrinchus TaxID=40147 RepID=A0AAD8FS22_ACIOX|nr:serine protease 27-like [Acipenser oxyrinchus oxyrinchus]
MKSFSSPTGSMMLLLSVRVRDPSLTLSCVSASECGSPVLNSRIVGGTPAEVGSWPWQVSLHFSGSHVCGGSLISANWVLSAAHCFEDNSDPSLWMVLLGQIDLSSLEPSGILNGVQRVIVHPAFNSQTMDNDMALLELNRSVIFTDYIMPVCLAESSSTFYTDTECWATGWGATAEGAPLPENNTLREVTLPVIGNQQCGCLYASEGEITDNMMCAGLLQGGKDACQGDSGGPLVCKQGSTWVQAGVVSFGIGCAQPGFPGVYARVSQYEAWIQAYTSEEVGFVAFQSTGLDLDTCALLGPQYAMSAANTATYSLLFMALVPVIWAM